MAAYPFVSFTAEDEKAIWLFGVYQGLCLSVTNLIPSLSAAVGSSGLPFITLTEAYVLPRLWDTASFPRAERSPYLGTEGLD